MRATLGSTGIVTSELALGCDRLGSTLTPLNRRQSLALLQEAFDIGIRHFDTASIYGQGDSERLIGRAFTGQRSEVCLATKAGQRLSPLQAVAAKFKAPIRLLMKLRGSVRQIVRGQRAGGVNYCFDPSFIESSLAGSLHRLQTSWVDIFYLHSPPIEALRDKDLMKLMERLRTDGKIRAIGVSCDDLELALAAMANPLVEIVQHDMTDEPLCHQALELGARNGKTSIVRGLARGAAQQAGAFEDNLIEKFRSAMSTPMIRGIITGTTDVDHLRSNAAAYKLARSQMQVPG